MQRLPRAHASPLAFPCDGNLMPLLLVVGFLLFAPGIHVAIDFYLFKYFLLAGDSKVDKSAHCLG